MGLNKAIEAARATIPAEKKTEEIMLRLTRHEWNKVAEALRSLYRSKQGKMRNLPEDDFRRKSFGFDIHNINSILDKIRKQV